MSDPIGLSIYAAGALAYLGLAGILVATWRRDRGGAWLAAACLATALWAASAAYGYWLGAEVNRLAEGLDVLHLGIWLVFLASLLRSGEGKKRATVRRRLFRVAAGLLLGLWVMGATIGLWPAILGRQLPILGHLALVTAGLVMVENLFRRSEGEARWRIKYTCIGLGGIFAYDLFLHAARLLFVEPAPALDLARGGIYTIVAPLLFVSLRRGEMGQSGITLSRATAYYSTALTASGLYLIAMAAAAYSLRQFGGTWSTVIQVIFVFGAGILLVALLASGTVRAHLKVFISKHFFRYKYDYRTEWLRFTDTLARDDPTLSLEARAIRAVADILDSPAGAIWLYQDDRCVLEGAWNMAASSLNEKQSQSLTRFLRETERVIDLDETLTDHEQYKNLTIPEPLRNIAQAWLIVPLLHQSGLLGFVLLARPRAPRALDWEDDDLLRTIGRHAASFLAEQAAARALAETREFEKLNRRFAFVLHDIKNLASQLSLIASNFRTHGDNPAFRAEMVDTLQDASARMKRMMDRLQAEESCRPSGRLLRIKPLLERIVSTEQKQRIELDCDLDDASLAIAADKDRLEAVIRHLVENATEAVDGGGPIRIALRAQDGSAVIEVVDNGRGMDHAYIRDELFRPFRTTKKHGFGIGAYQCREYARELGGDLEAISSPGSGTIMRITIPIAESQRPAAPVPTSPEGS